MNNITEIFALLSVPTRLKIVSYVASKGEVCAKDILPVLNITQPTLSHHMNEMVEGGVLKANKVGRCIYYSVNKEVIGALDNFVAELKDPTKIKQEQLKKTNKSSAKPQVTKTASAKSPKIVVVPTDDEIKKAKKSKDKDKKKKKDKEKKKKK